MTKMTRQNLHNIKQRFEAHTGTDLNAPAAGHISSIRQVALLAAALIFVMAMLAASPRLFSPLDQDQLVLRGTYQGGGIVSVYVENKSDKVLRFQEKTKLIRWVTGEEAASLGGNVRFENTEFPPNSSGTMTVDLSDAYDTAALETAKTNAEVYYLLLTNHDFLFSHDWMCSFTFAPPKESPHVNTPPQAPAVSAPSDRILPELRFYFEETYNVPLALQQNHALYQQTVEELLARFDGNVACSLSPSIMVSGPSEFLDPEPMVRDIPEDVILDASVAPEQQYLLTSWEWHYTDGYGRFVATAGEKAMVQMAFLPQRPEDKERSDGGVAMPLVFHLFYDAQRSLNQEHYVFVYGRLLSFQEMEQYLVRRDAHYAIYDVTPLIYRDVDAYLDFFLSTRTDVYCDDQIRQRVRNIYTFYRNRDNAASQFYYTQTS